MLTTLIKKLLARQDLTAYEMQQALNAMLSESNEAQ